MGVLSLDMVGRQSLTQFTCTYIERGRWKVCNSWFTTFIINFTLRGKTNAQITWCYAGQYILVLLYMYITAAAKRRGIRRNTASARVYERERGRVLNCIILCVTAGS